MSRFVQLTRVDTTQKVFVHSDSILKFWRPEDQNYTVVELTNGTSMTVQEAAEDIWNDAEA